MSERAARLRGFAKSACGSAETLFQEKGGADMALHTSQYAHVLAALADITEMVEEIKEKLG